MLREQALHIAQEFGKQLLPFCQPDRIHIAGSIRRGRPEVKDIEIVCLPSTQTAEEYSLFGEMVITKVIHPGFLQAIKKAGTILKGKPEGRHMQIQLPDIILDLFMPQPDDYFRQYCIRTGSAEYVHQVIALGWNKKGWCGCGDLGLRLMKDCRREIRNDKPFWRLVSDNPQLPPAWQSEKEFFNWLGIDYVPPQYRNL